MRQLLLGGAILLVADASSIDSRELMSRAAAAATDCAPGEIVVRHSCRHCGSSEHGQPVAVRAAAPHEECAVSFSSAGSFAVAAAHAAGQIGVDIDSYSAVSAHRVDDVLLHPEERVAMSGLEQDAARRYLGRLWVVKEAVVKATGDGMRIDLRELMVTFDGSTGDLRLWPSAMNLAEGPQLTLFDLSADVTGALAVAP